MTLNTLGIRKEDETKVDETRTPLVPRDIAHLRQQHPNLTFIIEAGRDPDDKYPRSYTDDEYTAVGATVDDINAADIIFGIKEIRIPALVANKTYAFFSHTYKGQERNMPMLRTLRNLGCSLIDYELIVEDIEDELYELDRYRRKVFFGHMAGYAGAINTLYGLGRRFAAKGIDTPFNLIKQARDYTSDYGNFGDFQKAMVAIKAVGDAIRKDGIPTSVTPIVIGITGHGNVGKAVRHILEHLPHDELTPEQLLDWHITPEESQHQIYIVHFSRQYRQTLKFEQYLQKLTALMHGAKWLPLQDRIVTRDYFQKMPNSKLEIIGDISCDPNGAIEMSKPTYPDNPIYTYFPERDDVERTWSEAQFKVTTEYGVHETGIPIMAVTNLPTEFAREASASFSQMLSDFIGDLIHADLDKPFDQLDLPRQLKRAFILHKGDLTPQFDYLASRIPQRVLLLGAGRMAITVMDYLMQHTQAEVIVADANLEQAKRMAAEYDPKRAIGTYELAINADSFNDSDLNALIADCDVVISLLPAFLHPIIAEIAIEQRTHMVTASYVSDAMQALDAKAKAAGVLLLNEVGVDPGLDHMSAMRVIHRLNDEGKTIKHFKSYCGGIPYTLTEPNPLNFKASWSPQGILSAVNRPARFIVNNQTVEQAPIDVFAAPQPIAPAATKQTFEGYPNGNAEQYRDLYGLHEVETLIRGTLRGEGWSHIFHTLHTLGWFGDDPAPTVAERTRNADLADGVQATVAWLKLDAASDESQTAHEYISQQFLSQTNLAYQPDELDQIVMVHQFEVEDTSGTTEAFASELHVVGEQNGHSAMAKTVGLPCAIATRLILDGDYQATGVQIPVVPELYNPILDELEGYGIVFDETGMA